MKRFLLLLLLPSLLSTSLVSAKPLTLDGHKQSYQAGDIIRIPSGEQDQLIIQNFTGSAEKPVIFTNNKGQVHINSTLGGGAILIKGCKHIRLSGAGSRKTQRYGFKIACNKKGPHALNLVGRSSSIEIDHIEIYAAGFAGFNIKDEPNINAKTTRKQFVMRNISIHDNYVHDTQGEGFYIGHTFYDGYDPKKTGKPLYPHVIKGLRLYNNITKNTGCEGIQVGSTETDCEIYNNTILNSGVAPFAQWQDNGMQIGAGTQARVYNNLIDTCPSQSLIVFGRGKTIIENNLLLNSGKNGVYTNTKGGDTYVFRKNTIFNSQVDGIAIGNWRKPPAQVSLENNLFIMPNASGSEILNQNQKAKISLKGNLRRDKLNIYTSGKAGADLKITNGHAPLSEKAPTPWLEKEPAS